MDYFLFPNVKSNLMRRRFDIILDVLNKVTSEFKSVPVAEFCGDIQKLYDRASRHMEFGGLCVVG